MATKLDDISLLLHPEGRETPEEMTIAPDDKPAPRRRGRPPKSAQPKPLGAEVPPPGKPAKVEVEMPDPGVLAEGIQGFYTFAGMGLMPFRPQTGMALAGNAEEIGKAWEQAARENPAIRKALLSLMKTTTVGVLVAAHLPVVMVALGESKELKAKRAQDSDADKPGATGPTGPLAGIPAVF